MFRVYVSLVTTLIALAITLNAYARPSDPAANAEQVRVAFQRWSAAQGSPFELLADEASWTIEGRSLAAGTYSRQDFMNLVIQPFNGRMSTPLKPAVRHLYADGDTVVALFDAQSTTHDGQLYKNTYIWILRFDRGKIVEVNAMFDSLAFDEMWTRVSPRFEDGRAILPVQSANGE